jgi:hypothetical protein
MVASESGFMRSILFWLLIDNHAAKIIPIYLVSKFSEGKQLNRN